MTKAELDAGRAKALALWNGCDTDGETAKASLALLATTKEAGLAAPVDVSLVEDAAWAFAIVAAAARIDSQNMNLKMAGIVGDPAQNIAKALPTALQVIRDYGKWVVETKTRMASIHLGV